MNKIKKFEKDRAARIKSYGHDQKLKSSAKVWLKQSMMKKYVYNFSWLGRPIIQTPQDIMAFQEIVWDVKPDMIIETGIAHGGSLILSASMLTLLEQCGHIKNGKVLGVDIDIRKHNLNAIKEHIMSKKITMIQGSSIDKDIVKQVYNFSKKGKKILVCLDSNHTHDHVLTELEFYSKLVSVGSYCIVFDTLVENMPRKFSYKRPWSVGNNPKTAVLEFLKKNKEFKIEKSIHNKLMVTVAEDGYLKRIK